MDSDDEKAPATTSYAKTVFLKHSNDWDNWIGYIAQACMKNDVWQYSNPVFEVHPLIPLRPLLPVLPEAEQFTPIEMETFRARTSLYDRAIKEYTRYREATWRIDKLIVDTINPKFQASFRSRDHTTETTTWAILRALRLNVAPSQRSTEMHLKMMYEQLKNPNRRMPVHDWVESFKEAVTKAKLHHLPFVADPQPQLDFLSATKIYELQWSLIKLTDISDLANAEIPSLERLIASFNTIRTTNNSERVLNKIKGSRTPTVGAVTTEDSSASFSATYNGERAKKGPLCLCGQHHFYAKCYYLNAKVRPSGWTPDKAVQADVDEQMKNEQTKTKVESALKHEEEWLANKAKSSHSERQARNGKKRSWSTGPASHTNDGSDEPLAFAVASAHSTASTERLKNHWILDSGSDIHITNSREGLQNLTFEKPGHVIAGATQYAITARGTATIDVETSTGRVPMTLSNVAFVPHFMTNIVSLSALMEKGVHWSTREGHLTRRGKPIATVERIGGHWTVATSVRSEVVLADDIDVIGTEAVESTTSKRSCFVCEGPATAAFPASLTEDLLSVLWHRRLAHPGPRALSHLWDAVDDVPRLVQGQSICETCLQSKSTKLISRSDLRRPRRFIHFIEFRATGSPSNQDTTTTNISSISNVS